MNAKFKNLADILSLIARTGSTSQMRSYLIQFKEVPDLQLVLKHLYNPYVTTGIKDRSLDDAYMCIIGSSTESRYTCLEDSI